mmetsp:Transcript_39656/g.113571  ORF Transcript_39656/g.113571 Transcript_39656/m.113571 type:complete len:308 (-) Transcript_39656:1380-2303(-)
MEHSVRMDLRQRSHLGHLDPRRHQLREGLLLRQLLCGVHGMRPRHLHAQQGHDGVRGVRRWRVSGAGGQNRLRALPRRYALPRGRGGLRALRHGVVAERDRPEPVQSLRRGWPADHAVPRRRLGERVPVPAGQLQAAGCRRRPPVPVLPRGDDLRARQRREEHRAGPSACGVDRVAAPASRLHVARGGAAARVPLLAREPLPRWGHGLLRCPAGPPGALLWRLRGRLVLLGRGVPRVRRGHWHLAFPCGHRSSLPRRGGLHCRGEPEARVAVQLGDVECGDDRAALRRDPDAGGLPPALHRVEWPSG